MTKIVLWLVAFAVVAAALFFGTELVDHNGFVLISLPDFAVEMTIFTALAILAISLLTIRLLWMLVRMPFKLKHGAAWLQQRKHKAGLKSLNSALSAMLLGDWQQAQKQALNQADDDELSQAKYLLAAYVANRNGQLEDSAKFHLKALQQGQSIDKELAMAQSLRNKGQLSQAISKAENLYQQDGKQAQVLTLLASLYQESNQSDKLIDIIADVKKYCQLSADTYDPLLRSAFTPQLNNAAQSKDIKLVNQTYKSVSKLAHKAEDFEADYLNALITVGDAKTVEKRLIKALKQGVDNKLLNLLQKVQLSEPNKLIEQLEAHIKKQPNEPKLISALGYVAFNARNWDLAHKALEQTIRAGGTRQDCYRLGQVFEHLEQYDKARACFKRGLELS